MKPFHKNLVKYNIAKAILLGLVFTIFFINEIEFDEGTNIIAAMLSITAIVLAICAIASLIYSILYYKTSGYELQKDKIVCKRGVIFKKISYLDYSKINTVNKYQNIIHKLFKLSVLLVDSGSTNTAHQAEVVIVENDKEVLSLIAKIESLRKNEEVVEEKEYQEFEGMKEFNYKYSLKEKLISSIICGFTSLYYLLIIPIIARLVLFVIKSFSSLAVFILGAVIVISLVVSVIGFIIELLSNFNYKIHYDDDKITISHGLLVYNNNTFAKKKIRAVRIEQSIIHRIFNLATVKLEVIGFGLSQDENQNQNGQANAMLFPIVKVKDINGLLDELLGSYQIKDQTSKAKALFPFMGFRLLYTSIFFGIILLIGGLSMHYFFNEYLYQFIFITLIVYLLFMILIVISSYCAFHVQDIIINEDEVTLYTGSFSKQSIVINKKNITSIEEVTTHFRKKKNISTYAIHFHTNNMTNVFVVKNLDSCEVDKLIGLLKF